MSYSVFKVQNLESNTIIKISLNRPQQLNAMNPTFFTELESIFTQINGNKDVRVVIMMSEGRLFCAGLDLKQFGELFTFNTEEARNSIKIYNVIRKMQNQLMTLLECHVPVLIGIHNACIGGGMDLISMADIRYCTKDAYFSIKEIDIGMAADIGTLQMYPHLLGNDSTFREMAYTGRKLLADEAQTIGVVSKVFETKQKMWAEMLVTAKIIASKSPVGIYTIKQVIKRQMLNKVSQNFDYVARTNSAMLFTKDTKEAISAFLEKRKAIFAKL